MEGGRRQRGRKRQDKGMREGKKGKDGELEKKISHMQMEKNVRKGVRESKRNERVREFRGGEEGLRRGEMGGTREMRERKRRERGVAKTEKERKKESDNWKEWKEGREREREISQESSFSLSHLLSRSHMV